MNKFLKWILLTVGFVVGLFIVAAVVIPMAIDPNNYKTEISEKVFDQTGRELQIGGEIEWSLFPSIALGLTDISLSSRKDVPDDPAFDVGRAEVSIKLVPLFSKRVELGKVRLSDVSMRMPQGTGVQTEPASSIKGSDSSSSAVVSSEPSFSISGMEIRNAYVTLDNADTGAATGTEQAFDLKGGFEVSHVDKAVEGDVEFAGIVRSDTVGGRFQVSGLDGVFEGHRNDDGKRLPLQARLAADADVDLSQDTAVLKNMVFGFQELLLTGDLDVVSVSDKPVFEGKLNVEEFNPRSLMQSLGMDVPETRNKNALTRLQADLNFSGSANSARLQSMKATLDDSNIEGNMTIDNFDMPRLAFDLVIDRLNLDDYSEKEAAASSSSQGTDSDVSVNEFRSFTGGGDVRIGSLVVSGLTATDVSTRITSSGSDIRFYPVKAKFYGGTHEGEIRIDASGSRPILTADLGLTGVQAGELMNDLTGEARLQGQAEVFLQIQSDISNSQTSLQSLSGDIGMAVFNGAIVGIDVSKTLGLVQSALGKKSGISGQSSAVDRTEFAELSMSGVISGGIMKSNDLIMQSPLLSATGKGSFNLVNETIDYILEPTLAGGSGVDQLDKLSGAVIPIRFSGNLYAPEYKVDVASAIMASQKDLIDEKKNELIQQLLGGKKKDGKKKDDDGN